MNSRTTKFTRLLAIAAFMSLIQFPLMMAENTQVSDQQINPTPDPCCNCISMTVSGQIDKPNPSGKKQTLRPSTTGDYTAKVTVQYGPRSGSGATCNGSQAVVVTANVIKDGVVVYSQDSASTTVSTGTPTADIDFILPADKAALGDKWEFKLRCADKTAYCSKITFDLDGGECTDCQKCQVTLSPKLKTQSFDVDIPTGRSNGAMSQGMLTFYAQTFANPGRAILVASVPSEFVVNRDGNGIITSITTGTGTVEVSAADVALLALDTNAFVVTHKDASGAVYRTTTISLVTEAGVARFRMDSTFDGSTVRYEQTQPVAGTLVMEEGEVVGGVFESLSQEALIKTEISPTKIIHRRIIKERAIPSDAWATTSDVETTWEDQVDGWQLTKEVIDPDGVALTSTWAYYQPGEITGSGGSNEGLGRLKRYVSYRGHEAFYTYSLNQTTITTPYAGNVSGKVQTSTWDPGTQTMTGVTTVNGTIIAKTVSSHTATTTTQTVYTSASGTLTTVTTLKPSGQDFGGMPIHTLHPDGTLTTYTYTRNTGGGYTTVTENGSTTNGTTVAKGTRNTSTSNARGTIILTKTEGIGYGTGSAIYGSMAVTSVDNLGRALTKAYHPTSVAITGEVAAATSPAWLTTSVYSCCGVASETDMYGVITYYAYDHLQRQIKSNRLGVTTETQYKGLTTETHRYPETVSASLSPVLQGTSATLVSKSVSNLADTLQESWFPDPTSSTAGALVKSSSTISCQPAAGLSIRRVVTTPDNYTQTTDAFLDGKISVTYGNLSPSMQYAYSVNASGETTSESHVDGTTLRETTITQSDWAGRKLSATYMDSAIASMEYNSLGQMVKSTDPDGVITLMAYNAEGEQIISAVDLNGNGEIDYGIDSVSSSEFDLALDDSSNPVLKSIRKVWQPSDASPTGGTVVSTSLQTPNGLASASQVIGVANPTTSLTTLSGNGNWTKTSIAPDGTKTVRTFTDGRMVSMARHDANNTTLESQIQGYDNLIRPITNTHSRTGTTTTAYLSATADVVASVSDAGNRITTFVYDIRGRQVLANAPDTIDADNNTLTNVTTTTYFPDGSISETNGDQTYRISYTYDYAYRKISMTTYGSTTATTTWQYSSDRGFLTRKENADGKGTDYDYTAAGRIEIRTWERGVVTTYGYDYGGRLVFTNYSDTTPDITLSYDAMGRQTTHSNGIATSTFTYNSSNLATNSETIAYDLNDDNTIDFTRVIDRSQDSLNRDASWQLKDGTTVENEAIYAYGSSDGRLSSVSRGSAAYSYAYTPNSSLLSSLTSPVHSVSNVYETDRDVLASKVNKVGTTTVSSNFYTVNNQGQRTAVNNDGTAFASSRNIAWGYNSKGEVVKADSSITGFDRAYEYDGIGNRQKSAESLTLPTTNNYTVNALNHYTAVETKNTTYDNDGNATAYPLPVNLAANSALAWDGENRLISVTVSGGDTVTYLYDSQSRRIAETVGSATIIYIYDGWNPIAEYSTTYALTKTYTWGMDLSGSIQGAGGVGGLLSVSDGTGTYYPTYDGNGNVSEYLDATGAIAAHYEYDPFGKTTVATGSKAQDFAHRFSTKPADAKTGLYYYGYRWYDPETGRWPSRDPIEEEGGINLYSFLGNNGINVIDLLGLDSSRKDCQNCEELVKTAKTNQFITNLIKYLDKNKCSTPISCKCLANSGFWHGTQLRKKAVGSISIACHLTTVIKVQDTLAHELIHAVQGCQNKVGHSCEQSACMEVQAYFIANCYHKTGQARIKCAEDGAVASIFTLFKPGEDKPCQSLEEATAAVRKVSKNCAKY